MQYFPKLNTEIPLNTKVVTHLPDEYLYFSYLTNSNPITFIDFLNNIKLFGIMESIITKFRSVNLPNVSVEFLIKLLSISYYKVSNYLNKYNHFSLVDNLLFFY